MQTRHFFCLVYTDALNSPGLPAAKTISMAETMKNVVSGEIGQAVRDATD